MSLAQTKRLTRGPTQSGRGFFITFEGIEGSGKSTQLARLARYLKGKGYPVHTTRAPGGTKIGAGIRALLLERKGEKMAPKTELLLYLADRAQHLAEVIRPALADGQIVLSDRFFDSTLAYQGHARGLAAPKLEALLAFASETTAPDRTFLLDMDVPKGLSRVHRRKVINRLDREDHSFHQRVREGYQRLARKYPHRIRLIHADSSEDQIFSEIQKIVDADLS